jgi:tetratricopeptide (TPR) repeat protein
MGRWTHWLHHSAALILAFVSCSSVLAQESSAGPSSLQTAARRQAAASLHSALAQLLKDHDAAKARSGFLAAGAQDPSYAMPFYELGLLAETQDDWSAATQWFTKFRQLDADSENSRLAAHELERLERIAELEKTPEGRKNRLYDEAIMHGEVLLQFGFPKEAVAEAARAARIDGSRWEPYVLGAQALSCNRRFIEAEAYLKEALARVPDEGSQPAGLSGLPGARAKIQLAIEECQKEEHYQELLKQAKSHVQQKKYADASEDYRSALKDYPTREECALAYGDALAMSGAYAPAAKLFTDLRSSIDPAIAQHARESLGRLALRNIVAIPQNESDKLNQLAQTHATQGNLTQAESEYKLAIEDEPSYWEWHSNLASLYSEQSRWPEAEAEYARAYLLDPKDTGSLSNLGAAMLQEHKWADAMKVYRQAIKLEPSNALHHDNLGTTLYSAGQRPEAVREYQQAVKLDPANPTYRSHLAAAQGHN